jgi:hypothetical protein
MNMQASLLPVTREPIPEDQRHDIAERLFGVSFPLQLEPVVYGITDRMVGKYTGGNWDFYTLSNGGFCMAPAEDMCFHVKCQEWYQGDLSADAPGITACLYAYSNLSFSLSDIAREYARQYHLLREYMLGHPEAGEILGATDRGDPEKPVAPVSTRRRLKPLNRMGKRRVRRVVSKVFSAVTYSA